MDKENVRRYTQRTSFSRVGLFATPWTEAHQAPLSKGFSRQEYWSELPCPPPGDLPSPGLNPHHLVGRFFTPSATWEAFQKEEILQMNLEDIIPSEISQSRKTNIA